MSAKMLMVFCYDIQSNRTRNKVAKTLEEYATRVQFSVFEARMSGKVAKSVTRAISRHLQPGDSLRVYAVGANGLRRSLAIGSGPPLDTPEQFWLV